MANEVTVSAPGSIMLTGEHAVVYGHPAIVAAIDQRVTVRLRVADTGSLTIRSEIADAFESPLDQLRAEGPYRFVIAAVLSLDRLPAGLEIDIRSDIDPTLGLGSSAAVTVALLAALHGGADPSLHGTALSIIQKLQGRGSGADLAASLTGGTIAYCLRDGAGADITPLPDPPPLSLFNVGYKTPTGEVLQRVAEAWQDRPDALTALYARMGRVASDTIGAARRDEWTATGSYLKAYQDLMVELGVSDNPLTQAIATATATPGVIGAKISGSGLGDCVVALGARPNGFTAAPLSAKGVIFHD